MLAVIDDVIKPLIQVSLSEGSSLQVTTKHPFYVDASAVRAQAGQVQADDLRVNDPLDIANGKMLASRSCATMWGTRTSTPSPSPMTTISLWGPVYRGE